MSIKRTKHSVNGKDFGMFYRFDDGRGLYLAWRSGEKNRSLSFTHNAWCLDTTLLRQVQRNGCESIGIAHRVGKKVTYYITNTSDFLLSPSEVHTSGQTPQRRLCRDRFQVDTSLSEESIALAVKLR